MRVTTISVPRIFRHFLCAAAAGVILSRVLLFGQDGPTLRDVLEQNKRLEEQIQAQQKQIDELRARLDHVQKDAASPAAPSEAEPAAREIPNLAETDRQVRISGEAGLAFFSGGTESNYPHAVFRVDDAKIFVEAPVWQNNYFFGELDLATRENNDGNFHLGELYLDMEDVLEAGKRENLSLRVGNLNIPFGEEYQRRGVMEDPLVTHSLSDLWGYDAGLEAYGALGPVDYVVAVQNAGKNDHKSLTARLGFNPTRSLHLSVSAHNTGRVGVAGDYVSPIWFGGGFFRAVAPTGDAKTFDVSIYEADAIWSWQGGHLGLNGGLADYSDDSPTVDNDRHLTYYGVEAMQAIAGGLSGVARFSAVRAPKGYPLMGQADGAGYFYSPFAPLTKDLQRLSLGLNYRIAAPLILKLEYSWERGHESSGAGRDDEDLVAAEMAIRF